MTTDFDTAASRRISRPSDPPRRPTRPARRAPLRRPALTGVAAAALAALLLAPAPAEGQYVPPRSDWESRAPAEVGMDAAALQAAVDFAVASESDAPRDLEQAHYLSFGREPHGDGVGPFKVRGGAAGLVIRNGYVVAEWGDTRRVDMTFSVSKSFLSTTVGLAWDRGLIVDVHDPVGPYMAPVDLPAGDGEPGVDRTGYGDPDPAVLFRTEHNEGITWDHLLRQTSNWEGTLWGKPDWADRPPRDLGMGYVEREREAPGASWTYNDVRVNLLALAATNVWREPLQVVLREHVMDPIGASRTWRWHGYENSWITLDGRKIQVPSGGGHWGGGMFLSARDQARFGLFTLRRGMWGEERLLDEAWFDMATTPTEANPGYGFMNYFLNAPVGEEARQRYPSASPGAFAHLGSGTNMIYVDPAHDLVVVARWIEGRAIDDFLGMVLAAVER